jgi:diguanylate cyclase (GGDEF)-like protein
MMTADPFLDEDYRVLTPEAFEFVLNNELKRALRSQNYLTLVSVKPHIAGVPDGNGERDHAVRQIARLISHDVRETDLLAETGKGRLSLVLLDADLQNSMTVIERLRARLDAYAFPKPLTLEIGAATCPTHGADIDSLRRAAEAQAIQTRRDDRGTAPNSH